MSTNSPSEWRLCKLDELGFVGRGRSRHRPRNDPKLYGGPYPFIQTGDISGCDVYITSHSQTYSELGLSQSKMWDPGTLCIVNAGENTGETGILTFSACFPDSVIAFIADPTKSDVRFVNYSVRLSKAKLRSVTKGATQDNLSLEKLLSFPIATPPLPIQQRIAAILSGYDDLIENNTKRIKVLEEMARSLYREWFVQFRYPGHEKVKLVDSALGKVPEGWTLLSLTTAFDVRYGKTLPKPQMKEDGIFPVYGAGGQIGRYDEKNIDTATTLITSRGAGSGTVWRARNPAFVTNNSFIVQPTQSAPFQNAGAIELCLSHANINSFVGGAAQPQLTLDGLAGVVIAKCPLALGKRFDQIVGPLYEQSDTLMRANDNLRRTRDMLLPKLISGELDVT